MPDCTHCPYASHIARLEKDLDALRQSKSEVHDKLFARVSDLEQKMVSSNTERAFIATQLKDIKADLKELRDMIEERQELPAKRWDLAIAAVISSGVSLLMAWLSAKLTGGV